MYPVLDNAMKDVFEASRYLVWWRNRPEKALEIVTPLHSLEMPEGVETDKYDRVMSFVMAVTGDCYVTMKEPVRAAEWYRKAANHNKCGGYPSLYADIVLKHHLSSHYRMALECMEANDANWKKQSILVKLLSHLISRWWLHPQIWRLLLIKHSLFRRLQDRINVERTP